MMRKWREKWGSAAGALLCVLVILFAAVYTRQDDIRRLAAQNAAADQSQTLDDVQTAPQIFRPVSGKITQPFDSARQSESGLWSFSPTVGYQVSLYQEIYAVADGICTFCATDCIVISHENGLISRYEGTFLPEISINKPVSAGQRLARISGHEFFFSLKQNDRYIDPEAFFLSSNAK